MSQNTDGSTILGTPAPVTGSRAGASTDPEPVAAPPSAFPDGPEVFIGQELNGYTIRRKLDEGGMGKVYEAIDDRIGRQAAIKVLRTELCRSEDMVERFCQEGRAVNAIRHENIVDIYDFGRDPHGRVYFVMEYLEGEPLSARMRRGALPWAEAYPILEQILRALKAVHDKGFVHRDLKPDNIWLRTIDGGTQVKLLDFGIAKLVGDQSTQARLTQAGSMLGTPQYMSPEQIHGSKDVDRRSDIYALGVMMFEMFSGVSPFSGDTLQAIMGGHLFRDAPRLANLPESLGVPPAIADIIDLMLVKDPAGRYQSATDLLADLRDVHQHRMPANAQTMNAVRQTRAQAANLTRSVGEPRTSHRRAYAIAGALVGAAAIAGIAMWQAPHRTPSRVVSQPAPTHELPPPPPPAAPAIDYDAVRNRMLVTLRASLKEALSAVRVLGSELLGKVKDAPSRPALAQLTERDPDDEVRGHAGEALGTLGSSSDARLLARLEAAAPPSLRVWYASALARLGDKAATKRLFDHARSKDLAVAFKAGLTLSEVCRPGDKNAIAVLRGIAAHESELNSVAPYAGALILSRLAALRDPEARKLLYALLEHADEGARLAAAEGLARLGDDAGKKVLHDVFTSASSPNRLVAAIDQVMLGEYGGLDLITGQLTARDPETRRLAARALGDIGERKSLAALLELADKDADWTVRISAAAAIVGIVGLDPVVLAQASVDWTASALRSQDWATRKAAAGVLADIPEKQAVPLLAQAIVDTDRNVRLAASTSARKMKSAEAAIQVASAAKTESDPGVKEQQVKALGEIGSPAVRDTLAEISEEPGRIGVLAAGSLIAVGDPSAKAKLDVAVAAPEVELRLAAVEAAQVANNPIVVPTLKIAILDKVFTVRFTAAEGLAAFNEKAAAVPVLNDALVSKDADVVGRALAALARLGEKVKDSAPSPSEMLDSPDARARLAAVPIVRALPVAEAVPLLRRLVADSEPDVRHAGVDAIEAVAAKDKDEAVKLYKPLVSDADAVVRSKAAGQLSKLVPPPPAPPPPPPPSATPAVDDALPRVKLAADETAAARAAAKQAGDAFEALGADLAQAMAASRHDNATTQRVEELANQLEEAVTRLEVQTTSVESAAQAASDAAGASPSGDAARLVAEARQLARSTREAAGAARGKATELADRARRYVETWTGDIQMFIAKGIAAEAAGNLTQAKQSYDNAARLVQKSGIKYPTLDSLYGQLYDRIAEQTAEPAAKRKLLQQAQDAYRKVVAAGEGPLAQKATSRLTKIADEISALGAP